MIMLSNLTAQAIQPGQAVTFDNVVMKSGNGECHNRQAPNFVKLCAKGIYDVHFSGNVTGTAGAALQLAIGLGGYPVVQSAMQATPATEGDLVNVSAEVLIKNCCCDLDRLTIVNSGAAPVTLAPNSSLIIKRLS